MSLSCCPFMYNHLLMTILKYSGQNDNTDAVSSLCGTVQALQSNRIWVLIQSPLFNSFVSEP